MFWYMGSGDLSGFIVAIIIFIILIRISTRVGYGSRRNYSNRNRWRGGMFGPGFWYGNYRQPPFNNNNQNQNYNPYSNFNDPNNPYMNNNPANGSFNSPPPYNYNDPFANRANNNYAPPTYVPPGAPSNFSWPTPVDNVVSTPPSQTPSANNAVHSWQMPDNQVVLREVFVWARSVAGWHYAGKLLVDGGMSKSEIQGYAQGKFGVPENDLLCIEAPSFEDAQRTFRTYHPEATN